MVNVARAATALGFGVLLAGLAGLPGCERGPEEAQPAAPQPRIPEPPGQAMDAPQPLAAGLARCMARDGRMSFFAPADLTCFRSLQPQSGEAGWVLGELIAALEARGKARRAFKAAMAVGRSFQRGRVSSGTVPTELVDAMDEADRGVRTAYAKALALAREPSETDVRYEARR